MDSDVSVVWGINLKTHHRTWQSSQSRLPRLCWQLRQLHQVKGGHTELTRSPLWDAAAVVLAISRFRHSSLRQRLNGSSWLLTTVLCLEVVSVFCVCYARISVLTRDSSQTEVLKMYHVSGFFQQGHRLEQRCFLFLVINSSGSQTTSS